MAYARPNIAKIDPDELHRLVREHQVLMETVRESPVHFCVYDPEDRLIAWNRSYEQNYPKAFRELRERAMNRQLTYADLLRHELCDQMTPDALEQEVTKRVAMQASAQGEAVIRSYGNHTLRVHKYRLPSGAVAGLAVDITDLAERERELSIARQLAEESEAAKTRFLANMSHEIRTPMNGIMGLATLLADTNLDDAQRELVDTITTSAKALLLTINEVLDFSKIEAGKLEIMPEPFDLGQLIRSVASLLKPVASQKNIALNVELGDECAGWFLGDELRIRQCLLNIAGNAIKFTEKGSVTIRCESIGPTVSIAVKDTGIGIPPDQIEHVFDAFEQGKGRKARELEGTGLGLAITRQLVSLMQGRVSVESRPDVGSEFTMSLPLSRTSPPVAERTSEGSVYGIDTERLRAFDVLVADDNRTNRLVVEKMIGDLVGQLRFAEDGNEVVEMYQAKRPDIVFMDVSMPGQDGLEATREIRRHEAACGSDPVPVFGLTAHAMPIDVADCLAAGMGRVLSKPITKGDLLASFSSAFGQN